MVRLINRVTGTDMWVADNRAASYIARGHKPFNDVPPAPPAKRTNPPKGKTTAKTTSTKK